MVTEIISNEEMASYLNMILNSNELNTAYCQNPKLANSIFQNIGNILAKYYISTGDNSFESAKRIIDEYLKYGAERNFFQNHLLPIIEKSVAQNLSMDSNNLSLANRVKIQEYVYIRNCNNKFYTHCFPGALLEEISTNGLNISRELFKNEYQILSNCFKTAFKTGELNYCELSNASLSYATRGMPERVQYSIGGVHNLSDTESIHDAYIKSLNNNIQKEYRQGKISRETMKKMIDAGTKIIDFYAKGTSGIAVFRKNNQKRPEETFMHSRLIKVFSEFGKRLENTSLGRIIENGQNEANSNPEHFFEIYESMFKKIEHIYPDASAGISEFVNQNLAYNMSRFAIRNYSHGGNADGYSVANGIMSPNEFAIVTFETPREVVVRNQIQNKAIDSNQQSKIDKSLNEPSAYDTMKKDIQFLDKKFRQVAEMSTRPEMIERVTISKNQTLIIATIDGDKKAVGYTLAAETDQGDIYYNFNGKTDVVLKGRIADELSGLSAKEKGEIIEQFKASNPEYDDDNIEEEAINWYANQQYYAMPENKREELEKKILESRGKFIVCEREGRSIVCPLDQNTLSQEYHGEILYSRTSEEKYNSFFEQIRSEMIQNVDELGKQVTPEMADIEGQNRIKKNVDSQVREFNSTERKTK